MTGAELIAHLRRDAKTKGLQTTDRAIAARLGVSVSTLTNWKGRESFSAAEVVRMLSSVEKATRAETHANVIRPIVEFFKLAPQATNSGANQQIFTPGANKEAHPYLAGLKAELQAHRGLYMFYDSRGRALYAGQTRGQSLWKEINLAFNRYRDVQNIRRVNHPKRRQDFRTSDEIRRQILSANVRLFDLAGYVSAWSVADPMICDLEALLIRAFPNDLLNTKIENFGGDS